MHFAFSNPGRYETWDAQRGLIPTPRRPHAIGDALYFPDGIPPGWNLRPALDTDAPYGMTAEQGMMLLVREWPGMLTCYLAVRLSFRRRRNTPSNVQYALGKELRTKPEMAAWIEHVDAMHARGRYGDVQGAR